ncbi:1-aminocyclopropane-1-carboxylate deaminase/D-cysteine desulfhydrase [Exilibacterium tricleocarpae]|uniref:1-aminocyclopropane-1-carboxylate deaminase/D-cysteine desulfhydrase n=1 Tax=Exilibacterium tricleocarpae TaxID=2591008 RepID=UPI0015D32ED4|nr:pyridoxal-phosphate dependent enzyme [Exilibacterium tricleocarpae]
MLTANTDLLSPQQAAAQTPLQPIDWPDFTAAGLQVFIKREDLVDAACSGNKYYKLYEHLRLARGQGARQILSFGGAYSNHIHALAAMGQRLGLATIGVIRGERPRQLSPTLRDAEAWGMRLDFLSRADYREKHTAALQARLAQRWGEFYCVPEGGGDRLGALGCRALAVGILTQVPGGVDHVCVPCGTGATLAGIASALPAQVLAHGFAVLKENPGGEDSLEARITAILKELGATAARWVLHRDFHGGGYAKFPPDLRAFMAAFETHTGIFLDPVYTAKMLWGLSRLASLGKFEKRARIVVIHTGGLQGRRGFDLD